MTNILGRIVKSNSHTDYVCQIYSKHEAQRVPHPSEYAYGTFVSIVLSNGSDQHLVGLVYNTVLLNPDFGRLGPRLSSNDDLVLFAPDYLNERATLVGIVAVGEVAEEGVRQGVPALAAESDAYVKRLSDESIRAFHTSDKGIRLSYLPHLIARQEPLAVQLAFCTVQRLRVLLPDQDTLLGVIEDGLKWRLQIEAMGSK